MNINEHDKIKEVVIIEGRKIEDKDVEVTITEHLKEEISDENEERSTSKEPSHVNGER